MSFWPPGSYGMNWDLGISSQSESLFNRHRGFQKINLMGVDKPEIVSQGSMSILVNEKMFRKHTLD